MEGKQTKRQSLFESMVNVSIGFTISLVATFVVFPLFDVVSTPSKNVGITIFYTVISVVRSYLVRRYFNNSSK